MKNIPRFIAAGATAGAVGSFMVWPPLAPLFLAGVCFAYAAYRHAQTVVCGGCFVRFPSGMEYSNHVCPPVRTRKPRAKMTT
jgi:hypothetical protein